VPELSATIILSSSRMTSGQLHVKAQVQLCCNACGRGDERTLPVSSEVMSAALLAAAGICTWCNCACERWDFWRSDWPLMFVAVAVARLLFNAAQESSVQ